MCSLFPFVAGHVACVRILLTAGANAVVRNHAGRSPVVEAKLTRNAPCIQLLEARCGGFGYSNVQWYVCM
jgi:ankyrin repeat protein